MWRRVDHIWTDVSEERITSTCRASLQQLAHAGSSLADFSILKMEAILSSETSVHIWSTRRHIPEDGILLEYCWLLRDESVAEGNRALGCIVWNSSFISDLIYSCIFYTINYIRNSGYYVCHLLQYCEISTFLSGALFRGFMWFSQLRVIICQYSIKGLVFVRDVLCLL
jgi:hypothetical protein